MMNRWVLSMVLLLMSTATAQADRPMTHDGFYFRLTTGLGYGNNSEEAGLSNVEIGGLGGLATIGIGHSISPNLVLNVDIWHLMFVEPEIKVGGDTIGNLQADFMCTGIGLGVTYYVMPANMYLAASVGAAQLSVDNGFTSAQSDHGLGVNVLVGKEWWVSPDWGIGVAGQFLYASVEKTSTIAGGVVFSATLH